MPTLSSISDFLALCSCIAKCHKKIKSNLELHQSFSIVKSCGGIVEIALRGWSVVSLDVCTQFVYSLGACNLAALLCSSPHGGLAGEDTEEKLERVGVYVWVRMCPFMS